MTATERCRSAFGVHGQYLFVNAEKLVVAKGCCPTGCALDAARITATLRAVSAVRRALAD